MTDKPRSQAEYVWSVSKDFPCDSLHDSRMVAEFHNTVLAVYPKGEEIHFATANFIEDKTKLADWFYYGTDFDEARKDFAIRSNLVSQNDFLSKEEKLLVGDSITNGFETNYYNEDNANMALRISEKLDYATLSFERNALEKEIKRNSHFSGTELLTMVSACEHRRNYTELPDDYYQVVYEAEIKGEKGLVSLAVSQTHLEDGFPISNFTDEELLVIGDSCCAALLDWDNYHQFQNVFDGILEKINYPELEKNRPEDLDVEEWQNQKEAMENGEWEEDDEWEEEDER